MIRKKIEAVVLIAAIASSGIAQTSDMPVHGPVETAADQTLEDTPPGFISDGCSHFFDGDYRDCCVEHDLDYYKGGSFKERRASDKRLYRCVKRRKGWRNRFRASIMYLGVRAVGVSFLPTPFRWGFGRNQLKKAALEAKGAEALAHESPAEIKKLEEN